MAPEDVRTYTYGWRNNHRKIIIYGIYIYIYDTHLIFRYIDSIDIYYIERERLYICDAYVRSGDAYMHSGDAYMRRRDAYTPSGDYMRSGDAYNVMRTGVAYMRIGGSHMRTGEAYMAVCVCMLSSVFIWRSVFI